MAISTKSPKRKPGALRLPASRLDESADQLTEAIFGKRNGQHSARNGGLPDPGRFGVLSTTTPTGIAAIEAQHQETFSDSAHAELSRKRKPKPRQPAGLGKLTSTERAPQSAQLLEIVTVAINPNPWQPRKEFPTEEIAAFGKQIEEDGGLIEPIVVRLDPRAVNAYQLVDGERRLRAVRHLGWPGILAVVREYSDEQMQDLALSANDQRKDLNPLERATAYQNMIDRRHLRPVDLEKITGKSQPFISNHLRLLKLPKNWRQRVAAGELSLTHARTLMPFAEHPALLAHVDKEWKRFGPKQGDSISSRDFERLVDDAVGHGTEDIDRSIYSHASYEPVPPPKLTGEQLGALKIIELPSRHAKGKVERLATNLKLWKQICDQHLKAYDSGAKGAAKQKAKDKQRPPTAAELKLRAAERSRQFAKRLTAWKANWIRWLIGNRLVMGAKGDDETMFRVLLWAASDSGFHHKQELLAESIESATGEKPKKSRSGYYTGFDAWPIILDLEGEQLPTAVMAFARSLLWRNVKGEGEPNLAISDREVFRLGAFLKLNLAGEWKERKAGPLTEAFYNLFDKAALEKIAAGVLPMIDRLDQTKSALVTALAKAPDKKLPKEIAAAKEPKS